MRTYNLLLNFFILISLLSCKSDREKDEMKTKECLEKQSENQKYKSIDDALTNYDFAAARNYLGCYCSSCYSFNNGDKKYDCGSEDVSPQKQELIKIVRAEISFYISQGEYKRAETTAREADLMELYAKLAGDSFESNLAEMVEKKEFKKIHAFLSDKRKSSQVDYDLDHEPNYYLRGNDVYNNSARSFNSLLDKVLVIYEYEKAERVELESIIDLALPELIERAEKNKYGEKKSMLSDVFKKEAATKYLK